MSGLVLKESVKMVRLSEKCVAVRSATRPDVWHMVTEGSCSCEAGRRDQPCHHVPMVARKWP